MEPRPDRLALLPQDQDPKYKYRWLNTNDRNLREAVYFNKWEICQFPAGENPLSVLPGQSTDAPGGGVTRTRGDVVLARMPRDVHEATIQARIRDAQDRQGATLDTMVAAANENAHRLAKAAGLPVHGKTLVFREEVPES